MNQFYFLCAEDPILLIPYAVAPIKSNNRDSAIATASIITDMRYGIIQNRSLVLSNIC